MKCKIRMIFVLVLTLSLLTACSTDKNYIKEKDITDIKTNTQDTGSNEAVKVNIKDKSSLADNPIGQANLNVKKLGETKKVNRDSNKKKYKIKSLSYNKKEVNISFPSVAGLNDTKKQNKINKILKEEALVVLNDFYGGVVDNLSLKINYKITWASKNLLSVQYDGYAFEKDAAYPLDLLYTVNIDIDKGTKLVLKDYIKIDKEFVNTFRNYKVPDPDKNQMEAGAFKYILDTYSADDLLKYFNGADTSFKESDFTFSYFKEDALGISIEVPHAVGDHLEIELKYQNIKKNIKTKNKIWKDLLQD